MVISDSYKDMAIARHEIAQGYLSRVPERTVRVRLRDDEGFITIKGENNGAARDEYEYPIPADDARSIIDSLCEGAVVSKTRFIVPFAGMTWEIDEFHGRHEGLVIAEIELPDEDAEYELPPFVGKKVTGDPRYYNSNL